MYIIDDEEEEAEDVQFSINWNAQCAEGSRAVGGGIKGKS